MNQQTTFTPTADTARAFRDALGCFATGVTVVTINSPEGPMGFTANSFAAVSLDPPLVLWSPAKSSFRFATYARARHYSIHVLRHAQGDLVGRFVRSGAGFDGLSFATSPEGVPILPDTLARFDCEQHATHDGGDHLIIVGLVLRAGIAEGAPLIFAQGRYGRFVEGG